MTDGERLAEELTRRGLWRRCFGLVGVDESGAWWIWGESGWIYDDGCGLPVAMEHHDDIAPDPRSDATSGFVLRLLAEADPVALLAVVEDVTTDLRHGQPRNFGPALLRALLRAWGAPGEEG